MICQCFDGNAKYFDIRWLYREPLYYATVKFRGPRLIFHVCRELVYSILPHNLFFFISLCPVGLSLLNQKTLKHDKTIFSFRFLTRIRSSSYSPTAALIFLQTSSLVTRSLHLISKALTLQWRSVIHRHTEIWKMTRKRISFIFDPRDVLSFQMGFSCREQCERNQEMFTHKQRLISYINFITKVWKIHVFTPVHLQNMTLNVHHLQFVAK